MNKKNEKWYPSPYNHHKEVAKLMDLPKTITVFDSTLREGEETPGVNMPFEVKIKIAKKLEELGVTEMEIGYCAYIRQHREIAKQLRNEGIKAKFGSLIRIWSEDYKREIDENVEMGIDILELCGGASSHQREIRNLSKGQFMDRMLDACEYARKSDKIVDFYPYDSVRTDLDYLKSLIKAGVEAGADRVHISDTMGNATPLATRFFTQEVKSVVGKIPVQYHGHNDFGTAVANSCAAIEGGAEIVDLVINGLGDRSGNANLQETVMTLNCLYGVDTGLNLHKLNDVCHFVEKVTNFRMEDNKPIVGKLAFIHESDIHVQAILEGKWSAFEPFLPEIVGQKRQCYFGSSTDTESIQIVAKMMGIEMDKKALEDVMKKIDKEVTNKGFALEEEVRTFISEV